jgi:hypothetical protein
MRKLCTGALALLAGRLIRVRASSQTLSSRTQPPGGSYGV